MLSKELRSRGDPGVPRLGRSGRRSRFRGRFSVVAALTRLRHQEAVAPLVAKTQAIAQALHDAGAADFVVAPNIRTKVIDVTLGVAHETASSADALERTVRALETSTIGAGISRVTEDPFTPDTAQG